MRTIRNQKQRRFRMKTQSIVLSLLIIIVGLVILNQYHLSNWTNDTTYNEAPTEEVILRTIASNPTLLKKVVERIDKEEYKVEENNNDATTKINVNAEDETEWKISNNSNNLEDSLKDDTNNQVIASNPTLLRKAAEKMDKEQNDVEENNNDATTKININPEKETDSKISNSNYLEDALKDDTNNSEGTDDFCTALQQKFSSLSSSFIWSHHLTDIFKGSRHFQDYHFEWHDFTALLMKYITPRRLQTSVKALPYRHWDKVGEILNVAWNRYQFLKQQEANGSAATEQQETNERVATEPRKVSILVMGGSVTMGVQCLNNPVMQSSRFARRNCAWPTRLSILFESMFPGLVRVDQITLGGTNTESAKTIWDYALFPSDMPHPDIVIHAYSTNDMHVLSERKAMEMGVTLEDMILKVNQDFIRTILKPPSSCKDRPPPLLLYYDDYIGNEQKEIVKTHSFGKAAQVLANYYGFGLISYADAVRELIYADTKEDWFSPSNWPERQVHPGMGMHISSMWFVAYNLLNTATAYCVSSEKLLGKTEDGIPPLRNNNKKLKGEPKPVPIALPPELNNKTNLDDISSQWQESAHSKNLFKLSECPPTGRLLSRCLFSWIGGMERSFEQPKHLEKRMKPVRVSNDGWKASADNNKLGYEATKNGATFEIKLPVLEESLEIQTLNFMVMTSYGEKWKDSKIAVNVYIDRAGTRNETIVKTMDILGYHDRNTSETYNYKLDLEGDTALPKDILRMKITLVGGSTFKIMGMAMCDH